MPLFLVVVLLESISVAGKCKPHVHCILVLVNQDRGFLAMSLRLIDQKNENNKTLK